MSVKRLFALSMISLFFVSVLMCQESYSADEPIGAEARYNYVDRNNGSFGTYGGRLGLLRGYS